MASTQLTTIDYAEGRKFRVVKPGTLCGMQPAGRGCQQGWSKHVPAGTVLTCAGVSMTFGDGVPIVKWRDENNQHLANDCEFTPRTGGLWTSLPSEGYLEPL